MNNIQENIRDKYKAVMILHALGDTIGFKNGDWEFNYNEMKFDPRITLELVFEFISLGGVSNISLKNWSVSDDTVLHLAIASNLINDKYNLYESKDKLSKKQEFNIKNTMLKYAKKSISKKKYKNTDRYFGNTTTSNMLKWSNQEDDARKQPFDELSGGNGCAMRTLCIGLAYHKESDIDKLIDFSIITSQFTHNSPLGFLGGFASAYFISLALQDVHMNKWPQKLIDILESDKIKKYIDRDNNDVFAAYHLFIKKWKKYIELRFTKNKPSDLKIYSNLIYRTVFHYEYFTKKDDDNLFHQMGSDGASSLIMAYDGLIDCSGQWEKLIYYTMLHCGDSDTVGAIAGGLYGAVYGFGDVPKHMLSHLEYKKELNLTGEKLFNKYN